MDARRGQDRADWTRRPPRAHERTVDVVGLGQNAVDRIVTVARYPMRGGKERIVREHTSVGGQIASAIVGARRLGLRARYIGAVGDDAAGTLLTDHLREEAIAIDHLVVVPGAITQRGLVIVEEESGERTVFWEHDERLALAPVHVPPAAIADARILHVDAGDVAAACAAATIAREHGVLVTSDIDAIVPDLDRLLPLIDYLVMAEGVAAELASATGEEDALRSLSSRYRCCAITTLGARGAVACAGDDLLVSAAFAPPQMVDTTGAGDAFRAGLVYGIARELPLADVLEAANAVASLSCRALGATAALPTEEELSALLHRRR